MSDSLMMYMIGKVGPSKARKIVTFMASWGTAEEALAHEPSIEEYAAWWKQSAATAYREKAIFRECFPDEVSPSRLNSLGAERLGRPKGSKIANISMFTALTPKDLKQ